MGTALLPALARITDDPGHVLFRRSLARGLRLVIVLTGPAAIALLMLGQDGIRVVMEHGAFTPADTAQVTLALLFYLPGLPFAALDQLLVFAFYARRNTTTPVLVGIAGVGLYLLVSPLLAFVLHLGYIGLVVANSLQLILHCSALWVLLQRHTGSLAGQGLRRTALKVLLAAAAMGLATWGGRSLLHALPWPGGRLVDALLLLAAAAAGGSVYAVALLLLRVDEAAEIRNRLAAWLPSARAPRTS